MASTITADTGAVSGSAGLKSSADSSGVLAFATGTGTTAVTIDASQNVGVGVTPSAWGAGKAMEFNTKGNAIWGLGSNSMWVASNVYFDGSYRYANNDFANLLRVGSNNGQIQFLTAASGTAGNTISFTQAMTLDASGNLLVGNTTASSLANAGRGLIESSGSTDAAITVKTSNTINGYMYSDGSTMRVAAGGTLPLILWTNSAERARIDSSGNLLVGQTSTGIANATSYAFQLDGQGIRNNHGSGTPSGYAYMQFGYAGSSIGSITQSGTTAVLYNVTSDQRLKKNIVDAPEFGSVIDSIQVRSYDWKTDETHQRAGFIAQELVTVAPEAVHQPADPDDMMAVDYSKLVPMLVKEIQSLRQRVASLEA